MKGGGISGGGKKKSGGEAYSVENGAVPEVNGDVNGDHSENDCSSRSKEDRPEKNEEEELEDYDDQEEEYEDDNEKEEDDNDERSKLDDGFYEIETIRRKRVRKGQLQYLIKWRGWPETANTWEPLENLQSIADVVEAFEDSLRSGKSSRKRKRKSAGLHTQSNKKKTSSSIVVAYNITDIEIGVVDKTNLPPSSLTNTSLTDHRAPTQQLIEYNVDIDNGSKQIVERKDENEYDPKLSELRGTISTNGEVNGLTNGVTKVDDLALVNNRRVGAKKRKSGSVKRFKKDLTSREQVEDLSLALAPEFTVGSSGAVGYIGAVGPGLIWNNSSQKNVAENCRNVPPIVKIIKPIDFAASVSNNCQDVLVTFVAVRADGNEVIVDNKFLKIHNPLLLIDFYENHLKYSTP